MSDYSQTMLKFVIAIFSRSYHMYHILLGYQHINLIFVHNIYSCFV